MVHLLRARARARVRVRLRVRVVRCHRALGAPEETILARDEGAEVGVGARLEPEVGQRRPDRVDLPVGEIWRRYGEI